MLVRLWGIKHAQILSLEIKNGAAFLGVFDSQYLSELNMYLTSDPAFSLLKLLQFPQIHTGKSAKWHMHRPIH